MFSGSLGRLVAIAAAAGALCVPAAARGEGRFSAPARGETFAAGDAVEVRWTGPCANADASAESELLLSLDGGVTFPIRLTAEMPACATRLRWRVPAVASTHARLALRTGSGEESENEQLALLSDEFTIMAADGDSPVDLVAGPRELWTRQALEGDGAEDFPAASMTGDEQRMVAPGFTPDVNEPSPQGLSVPRAAVAPAARAARPSPRTASPASSRASAPLPLRL